MLEGSVRELKEIIAEHDGVNVADARFVRQVDELLSVFYDALNEMSERFIMGFDMHLIADKLLDNFNLYRRTGDEQYLSNARKYAAILKVDRASFPAIFRRASRQ